MAQTEQAQEQKTAETAGQTEVKEANLPEAVENSAGPGEENLDILLDINMPITVNVGKATVPFRRLLQLGPGSVLELDKEIGQPAEIYVQDIPFATGDIVVVNGCFAVRIKEVMGMDSSSEAASAQEQNKSDK